jgi:formylglycine-generating enzyme required for sulfatase activity
MAFVDAGTFTMGNVKPGPDVLSGHTTEHQVTLSAYCIDRMEVTVAAYAGCVAAQSCPPAESDRDSAQLCNAPAHRDDHPVNCVGWDQATAYCTWAGRRLPTEAEWEFAARGTDGRQFPWGNEPPTSERIMWKQERLSADPASSTGTAPANSYSQGGSPYGVLNLSGNVAEWVADWMTPYGWDPRTDPRSDAEGHLHARVARGGSWQDFEATDVDAIHRIGNAPEHQQPSYGFRCASAVPPR